MNNEYICGISVLAEDSDAAIAEVMPLHNFAIKVTLSDGIVCTPRMGVGIPLTVSLALFSIVIFSILGVIAGRNSMKTK